MAKSKFDYSAFREEVYEIVAQIPTGVVMSYGSIATLVGFPSYSRLVGRAMHDAPAARNLPCHRVVNSNGRTVPGWHQQALMLMSEGVRFRPNGLVDMKHFEWHIPIADSE